jgi:hypothetical protein
MTSVRWSAECGMFRVDGVGLKSLVSFGVRRNGRTDKGFQGVVCLFSNAMWLMLNKRNNYDDDLQGCRPECNIIHLASHFRQIRPHTEPTRAHFDGTKDVRMYLWPIASGLPMVLISHTSSQVFRDVERLAQAAIATGLSV